MNRNQSPRFGDNIGRQAGTTLIVALVLLLLATLLGLFAMNVGIFAQRTSAADLRARIVHQALEGALSRGIEYIHNNTTLADTENTVWKGCPASGSGTSGSPAAKDFPCGAVPQCATGTSSGSGCASGVSGVTSSDVARRGNMFYYNTPNGSIVDVNNNGQTNDNIDKFALPIGATSVTAEGFTVHYGVGAVMCMVKQPANAGDPTECTIDTNKKQGTYLFTVTAVGSIDGETASSTLTTTFGLAPVAAGAGSAPTVIASSNMDLTGNGTFTPNPNAAGSGVPLTIWTPACAKNNGAGTVNTCYVGDWMRSSGAYTYAMNSDGKTPSPVLVCDGNGNTTCSCSGANSISQGNGGLIEGIDVLTNDDPAHDINNKCKIKTEPPVLGTSACTTLNDNSKCKANYNVDETEFPCDLFQYIFKQQAWDDRAVQSPGAAKTACNEGGGNMPVGGGDCFCEYHKAQTYTVADGTSPTMGVDEAYLYDKASYIFDTDSSRAGWASDKQTANGAIKSCDALFNQINLSGGLVWDRTGGCLNGTKVAQIGYPDKPVLLVSDGDTVLQNETMFGLVFVRDTTAPNSATIWGGASDFRANGNGTIYGAVISQGTISTFAGSAGVIYSGSVMDALLRLPSMLSAAPVPGSWTDRNEY